MYLRFECPLWDDAARSRVGIFGAYDHLLGTMCGSAVWQLDELARVDQWFHRHLARPARLCWRSRRAKMNGVCWFLPGATRHVTQGRYMAWLLSDLGLLIHERRSVAPGRILWQDDHQIVASAHL